MHLVLPSTVQGKVPCVNASVKMMQSPGPAGIGRTFSSMCSFRLRYFCGRSTFALCDPGLCDRNTASYQICFHTNDDGFNAKNDRRINGVSLSHMQQKPPPAGLQKVSYDNDLFFQ